MTKHTRIWQLTNLVVICALIATLIQLRLPNPANWPVKCTLPTVKNLSSSKHLALSPNTRRAHERYSL